MHKVSSTLLSFQKQLDVHCQYCLGYGRVCRGLGEGRCPCLMLNAYGVLQAMEICTTYEHTSEQQGLSDAFAVCSGRSSVVHLMTG